MENRRDREYRKQALRERMIDSETLEREEEEELEHHYRENLRRHRRFRRVVTAPVSYTHLDVYKRQGPL